MKIGKLKSSELEKYVLKNIKALRNEVLIRGGTGIDTAVLDFDGDLIVTSTDPITGASKNIGNLSINISVNDICCQGADPVGVLLTVLLPTDAEIEDLELIIKDCNKTCEKLNLEIIGGHTEVTDAVSKIIISTTVLGRVNIKHIPKVDQVQEGDIVAISKYIGIEGSSIIYHDLYDEQKILSKNEKKFANELNNFISVMEESKLASYYNVKYMHDITEGGIYGAIWESSKAINMGIDIDKNKIPILDLTRKLCEYYKINPYKLISSGSMLMIFNPKDYNEFKKEASFTNIKVTEIGSITNTNLPRVIDGNKFILLTDPEPDELYRIII
ncbi:hydrogenase maturation factor [Peptoniphilus olsenii]|uniref:Hydrogenase maturation factor n=1 Tax=Peptoniphilus olsenii TaxID=411570 RepID=A0ABV2J7C8_9FIRM